MPYYKVKYSKGKNNEYVYPKTVAEAVWKSSVYYGTEQEMIGETDDKIEADGKKVISLTPELATKMIKEFQASHQMPKNLLEE